MWGAASIWHMNTPRFFYGLYATMGPVYINRDMWMRLPENLYQDIYSFDLWGRR